jgi:hypothetical protein
MSSATSSTNPCSGLNGQDQNAVATVLQQILGDNILSRYENMVYKYGTAGFRMPSDRLPSVVQRMGLLAALRGRTVSFHLIGSPLASGNVNVLTLTSIPVTIRILT